MRVEIEDLLKGMALLKGRLDDEKYRSLFKSLGEEVEKVLSYVNVQEKDELLREYLKRRWEIGGKGAIGCIQVLRKIKGVEKQVVEELGEMSKVWRGGVG